MSGLPALREPVAESGLPVRRIAPRLQTINDEVFGSIDARAFRMLTRMVEGLVAGAERALSLDGKK